ncbi:NAD(P)-binding protein [Ascobolus immersus RN42]|uniref:NAD(P)-binding protein n=1 Tax=Ascobolus immersus RN42 TaxID=1160509 RepID=A0A3N4HQY4_ASCIM|nr:NAD(P)-binding protein [Ascobolus immersus RN42]
MSTDKKLITVYAATGTQGSAVARSLLANPNFSVRGTTRNPSSDKAKALAAEGVEIVKADGFDAESLKAAFAGSWGIYVNTDSNDASMNESHGRAEYDQGVLIVDAALAAGVQHIVYSSLPSTTDHTGIANTPFDTKNKIEKYIRQQPFKTSSFIYAGWYMENNLPTWPFLDSHRGGFPRQKDEEGYVTLKYGKWGDANGAPYIAIVDDWGWIVHGMFLDPEAVNGKIIHGGSEELHYPEYVKIFTEVTGVKARYVEIDHDELPAFGIRPLEELVEMFKYIYKMDGRYMGEPLNLKPTEELKKKALKAVGREEKGLTTWRDWLQRHKETVLSHGYHESAPGQ